MVERKDPPWDADERTTLGAFLDLQRATLLWKTEGLTFEQLTHRHVSSKTTLLGLVKHLTDVERWWFSSVFDGQTDAPYYWEKNGVFDSEFDIDPTDNIDAIVQLYNDECERSRVIVARADSLEDIAAHPDKPHNLRWILNHMIEETARHVGHADILRELTDGAIGE